MLCGGNFKKTTMTEAEKERWQLIGVIATAVGYAITKFFATNEVER